jgi:phosphoribosylformylglycinamidine synthase
MSVKVLIITGYGINAEKELAWAFQLAGGETKIIHLEDLVENPGELDHYQIIGFPGGFSFGDHVASGRVFGNLVKHHLADRLEAFLEKDRLAIGICNGFQIITKLGVVPGRQEKGFRQTASLIENDSGHFEDRWVWLKIENDRTPWLAGLKDLYLPVRHGEGKFITRDQNTMDELKKNGQIALTYFNPASDKIDYPFNPNGSTLNIAGITSRRGNVLGLMPHPEAYIFDENHPRWTEGIRLEHTGLSIFKNGVNYFK